jgi:glyoxylase-like metal-dependent hydrolase (beta-lactamase superfamily II)
VTPNINSRTFTLLKNSFMKPNFALSIPIVSALAILLSCNNAKAPETQAPAYDEALLNKVRAAAVAIPGDLPVAINYLKYAASIRKWKDLIEGGSDDNATMARTAFQIEYPQGFIMVDAGMDRAVHHFFEKNGPQPFDDSAANKVALAVQQAKMVLVTHEHGDHVGGVIRNANNAIPSKTILTREQVNSLINNPQTPEIKLDEKRSKEYMIVDVESVLSVAPGVVLIKAPGHSPGELMIYAKLQNGKEYIFTGDVTWTYRGVEQKKSKPDSERKRLNENGELLQQQLNWLNERLVRDKMIILVSHDDVMLPQLAAQGLVSANLKLAQ